MNEPVPPTLYGNDCILQNEFPQSKEEKLVLEQAANSSRRAFRVASHYRQRHGPQHTFSNLLRKLSKNFRKNGTD
ncbi:MAG TPA: hypothetical protein VGG19_05965 [Tepidisphaeraceae bacterium]